MTFYKLLNAEENHNGYQFKTGLNTESEFDITATCSKGLYFTDQNHITDYLKYNNKYCKYIREVILPDSCQVMKEAYGKYKANRIILRPRHFIYSDVGISLLSTHLSCDKILDFKNHITTLEKNGVYIKSRYRIYKNMVKNLKHSVQWWYFKYTSYQDFKSYIRALEEEGLFTSKPEKVSFNYGSTKIYAYRHFGDVYKSNKKYISDTIDIDTSRWYLNNVGIHVDIFKYHPHLISYYNLSDSELIHVLKNNKEAFKYVNRVFDIDSECHAFKNPLSIYNSKTEGCLFIRSLFTYGLLSPDLVDKLLLLGVPGRFLK